MVPRALPCWKQTLILGPLCRGWCEISGTQSWRAILPSSQVFRGQKVFYLIKPTPENLKAYEAWICDAKQDSTFFPDTVGGSA